MSEDKHYLISVSDETRLWNVPERRQEKIFKAVPISIAISSDSQYLILGSNCIKIWNTIEKKI